MPTFTYSSKVRAVSDDCSLVLNARHRFVAGDSSDKLYNLKQTRIPDDVDVLLTSNLILTISGVLDGAKVSFEDIVKSAVAHHLVHYLRTNATELGLNTVSDIYLGDDDGLPKITLSHSHCLPTSLKILPPHVTLLSIDLNYTWQTTRHPTKSKSTPKTLFQTPTSILSHPFSVHLHLPSKTLLNNVVERFVTWQLVRRYPLIFGPWCKKLDTETPFFPVIGRSIFNMIERSQNPSFRAKCKRLIKIIQCYHTSAFSASSSSLSTYLESIHDASSSQCEAKGPKLTDGEALCLSMEFIYRNGVRRPTFKYRNQADINTDTLVTPHVIQGSIRRKSSSSNLADDEGLSQDLPSLPDSSQQFDESFVWNDPIPVIPANFDSILPLLPSSFPFLKPSLSMELDFDYAFDEPVASSDLDIDDLDSAEEPDHEYQEEDLVHLVWTDLNPNPICVDDHYFNPISLSPPACLKNPTPTPFLDDKDKLKLSTLFRPDYQRLQGLHTDIDMEQGTDQKLLQNEYHDHADVGQSPDTENSQAQDRHSYGEGRTPGLESGSQVIASHHRASRSPAILGAANDTTIAQGPILQEQEGNPGYSHDLFRPASLDVQMNADEYPSPYQNANQHVPNLWEASHYGFKISCDMDSDRSVDNSDTDSDSDLLDFEAGVIPEAVICSRRNNSHQIHALPGTCPLNVRVDHQHQPDEDVRGKPSLRLDVAEVESTLHWRIDTKREAYTRIIGGNEEWEEDDGLLLVDFEEADGDS